MGSHRFIHSLYFGQVRVIRKPLAGWMHFILFWGFIVLFIAAGVDAAHANIGWPHMVGNLYIGEHLIVNVFGFLALIGIIVLAYIRYVQKPERLNDTKASDAWILLLVFTILLSGYVIEGLRIAVQIKMTPFLTLPPYG